MRAVLVSLSLVLTACGPAQLAGSDFERDVAARSVIEEGSAEAVGVLGFLNAATTTVALLDDEVGLDARAAANLVAHRDGPDGMSGTRDDDAFDSIAEVGAVPQVGDAALQTLLDYAAEKGLIPEEDGLYGIVEGVSFTREQAEATLVLANTASFETLDEDVDLDARAAENIVALRPFDTVEALGAVAYVGPSALTKLRDHASAGSTAQIAAELSAAVDGLWYVSESDYPLTVFTLSQPGTVTADNAKDVFAGLMETSPWEVPLAEQGVETETTTDFFQWHAEPEDWWGPEEQAEGARWQAVWDIFENELQDAMVYRVGEMTQWGYVQGGIDVFVVGYTASGDLVGFHTVSVET